MSQTHTIGSHKTTVASQGAITHVTYHSTIVVSFSNESIVLNSGGWRSNTTKLRMNQTSNQFGLGFQVYQKNFEWFVDYQGITLDFYDGMTLIR